MSVSDHELEKIIDELTVKEIIVVLKLADMIIKRMRIYMSRIQKHTTTYTPASDIIAEIVKQAIAQRMGETKATEEEEIEPEKLKEFVSKLKKALNEQKTPST